MQVQGRRQLLKSVASGVAAALLPGAAALAAAPAGLKITRLRLFNPAGAGPLAGPLGLSEIIVAVDTDAGITGYGQGGTPDLLRYAGALLIGEDPLRIEHHWQRMYRSSIYPAGRERLHAVGALDCALWDLFGKALGRPVYQLLGGRTRDHIDCYKSLGALGVAQARDEARRSLEEGFRALRFFAAGTRGSSFDARRAIGGITDVCAALREGLGRDGDFIFDAHTRFDFGDALQLCRSLEPLQPLAVEDPLRTIDDIPLFALLRQQAGVPLAAGEQLGDLRDANLQLVEGGLIDFLRTTLPNAGGLTAYRKLAALCEAHSVGLVPHFTAPIAVAAIAQALYAFPG
ncbi:MAG: hypothetical protein RL026_379, partial [Pseudomonadota bacterium]